MTKCRGEEKNKNCPLKENCLRYTKKSKGYNQSYLFEIPYKKLTGSCEYLLS